jgi:hypothetical protein
MTSEPEKQQTIEEYSGTEEDDEDVELIRWDREYRNVRREQKARR